MPLAYEKRKESGSEMHCPGCKRSSLKRREFGVTCTFCGYTLTAGEEARFRLYELLK